MISRFYKFWFFNFSFIFLNSILLSVTIYSTELPEVICVGDQAEPLGSASYFTCELGNGHESEETADFLGTPHPFRKLRSVPFLTGVEPGAFRPGSDRALFVDVHPFVRYPRILIRQFLDYLIAGKRNSFRPSTLLAKSPSFTFRYYS